MVEYAPFVLVFAESINSDVFAWNVLGPLGIGLIHIGCSYLTLSLGIVHLYRVMVQFIVLQKGHVYRYV